VGVPLTATTALKSGRAVIRDLRALKLLDSHGVVVGAGVAVRVGAAVGVDPGEVVGDGEACGVARGLAVELPPSPGACSSSGTVNRSPGRIGSNRTAL
jgi:hypothetical protein